MARTEMGLDDVALAAVARTSVEASGAPDALKGKAAEGIDAWLARPAAAAS